MNKTGALTTFVALDVGNEDTKV